MKVCFFEPGFYPEYGGQAIYLREHLIPALRERGVECWAMALERADRPALDEYNGIKIVRIPRPPAYLPTKYLRYAYAMIQLRKYILKYRNDFDIFYFADGGGTSPLAVKALSKLGVPILLESTLIGKDDALTYKKRQFGNWILSHIRMVDHIICISSAIKDIYLAEGFEKKQALHVPYGLSFSKYEAASILEREALLKSLHIDGAGPVVVFVGGINRRKNIHVMIDAFAKVVQSFPGAKLMLVGPDDKLSYGDYPKRIREQIKGLSLDGHVMFTGMVNNVQDYLKVADLYISTSEAEGLGLGVIEAQACRTACVVADIPVTPDLVPNDDYGRVASVGDVDGFAQAMNELLSNDHLRTQIAEKSYQRVREVYNLDKRADRMNSLFKGLLPKSRSTNASV
tara:strand:- start:11 stop:1207 length:1197 start_codon:yes stop_codon:yes gene_type:complete